MLLLDHDSGTSRVPVVQTISGVGLYAVGPIAVEVFRRDPIEDQVVDRIRIELRARVAREECDLIVKCAAISALQRKHREVVQL